MRKPARWRSTEERSYVSNRLENRQVMKFGSGLKIEHGSGLLNRPTKDSAKASSAGFNAGKAAMSKLGPGRGRKKALRTSSYVSGAQGIGAQMNSSGSLADDAGAITGAGLRQVGARSGQVFVHGARGGMRLGAGAGGIMGRAARRVAAGIAERTAENIARRAIKQYQKIMKFPRRKLARAAKTRLGAMAIRAAQFVINALITAMGGVVSIMGALPTLLAGLLIAVVFSLFMSFFFSTATVGAASGVCIPQGEVIDASGGSSPAPDSPDFDGSFAAPLAGALTVTSPWGSRIDPISHTRMFHDGIDFAAPNGTPIYSAAPGTVTKAHRDSICGNMVEVTHGGGVATRYCHMSQIGAYVGQTVRTGQEIGKVGSTGRSTGNHLHFEIRRSGVSVDPAGYLSGATLGETYPSALDPEVCESLGLGVLPGDTMPVSASYPPQAATVQDPTTSGRITPRMKRVYDAINDLPGRGGVKSIGCWRPTDPYPDHPSGRACDLMYAYGTFPTGKTLQDGNNTATWLTKNAEKYGIRYLIWQGRIWLAQTGKWEKYAAAAYSDEDTNPTTGHFDHIHVTVW